MSEFKVGDKVYLKGEISDYDARDNTYCVKYYNYCGLSEITYWVNDDVLHTPDELYNKGLNDAWELAKKIVEDSDKGGYTVEELAKIFGTGLPHRVFATFTSQEAFAKAKEYEERNEIRVGDEIKLESGRLGIVTYADETSASALLKDGRSVAFCVEFCSKTGKHYDIESILNGLRGGD